MEIDFQMALLLQHRFEEELKSAKNDTSSDLVLAKQLQEQFEQEQVVEKPSNNLVYKPPKNGLTSSKSLTDPSWELVDPTPDIHTLFMAFNEHFFWNKLLSVCVSWSKRMTKCAGVCSYQGRGGLCSITLSEPLLKLRPRKDLVETLLHEMIHAYLFVTHNNKDREGHGPEFHKHMYRINKESGTHITVYHDFHDEVRLYQQHWWRCDGPCQKWKPYFGMVRRAMNRAPGPHDRWWGEHSRTCGGTFIKVKEPEKTEKKLKKTATKISSLNNNKDIRDFVTVEKKAGINAGTFGSLNINSTTSNVKTFKDLSNSNTSGQRIKSNGSSTVTITSTSITKNGKSISGTNSNINGFKDLARIDRVSSKKNSTSNIPNFSASTSTVEQNDSNTSSISGYSDEYLSVRNHWANKFNNSTKRPAVEEPTTSAKIMKTSENESSDEFGECPVCTTKVRLADLNDHLDECLSRPPTSSKIEEVRECPVCSKEIELSFFESHLEFCLNEKLSSKSEQIKECPVCDEKIECSIFDSHLDKCLNRDSIPSKSGESQECPLCSKQIEFCDFDFHVQKCVMKVYDTVEQQFEVRTPTEFSDSVACLACGRKILRSELNLHLEDCMVDIFDDNKQEEVVEVDKKKSEFNCPFCMELVEESEMQRHIDFCLKVNNSDILETFLDDDF